MLDCLNRWATSRVMKIRDVPMNANIATVIISSRSVAAFLMVEPNKDTPGFIFLYEEDFVEKIMVPANSLQPRIALKDNRAPGDSS